MPSRLWVINMFVLWLSLSHSKVCYIRWLQGAKICFIYRIQASKSWIPKKSAPQSSCYYMLRCSFEGDDANVSVLVLAVCHHRSSSAMVPAFVPKRKLWLAKSAKSTIKRTVYLSFIAHLQSNTRVRAAKNWTAGSFKKIVRWTFRENLAFLPSRSFQCFEPLGFNERRYYKSAFKANTREQGREPSTSSCIPDWSSACARATPRTRLS